MLKIKDEIPLKELEKFGFKRVQQNNKLNYIYFPTEEEYCMGNSILVQDDTSLYSLGYHIGEDRQIKFRFNTELLEFYKTIETVYDLIQAGLVEKVER